MNKNENIIKVKNVKMVSGKKVSSNVQGNRSGCASTSAPGCN